MLIERSIPTFGRPDAFEHPVLLHYSNTEISDTAIVAMERPNDNGAYSLNYYDEKGQLHTDKHSGEFWRVTTAEANIFASSRMPHILQTLLQGELPLGVSRQKAEQQVNHRNHIYQLFSELYPGEAPPCPENYTSKELSRALSNATMRDQLYTFHQFIGPAFTPSSPFLEALARDEEQSRYRVPTSSRVTCPRSFDEYIDWYCDQAPVLLNYSFNGTDVRASDIPEILAVPSHDDSYWSFLEQPVFNRGVSKSAGSDLFCAETANAQVNVEHYLSSVLLAAYQQLNIDVGSELYDLEYGNYYEKLKQIALSNAEETRQSILQRAYNRMHFVLCAHVNGISMANSTSVESALSPRNSTLNTILRLDNISDVTYGANLRNTYIPKPIIRIKNFREDKPKPDTLYAHDWKGYRDWVECSAILLPASTRDDLWETVSAQFTSEVAQLTKNTALKSKRLRLLNISQAMFYS